MNSFHPSLESQMGHRGWILAELSRRTLGLGFNRAEMQVPRRYQDLAIAKFPSRNARGRISNLILECP